MDQIKNHFQKQALTIEQQLAFLERQGLRINDPSNAHYVLSVIGYYRFSGYLLSCKYQ